MKKLKKVASIDTPDLDRILANTPLEDIEYVEKTMAIADRIHTLLEEKKLYQKDLAFMMDKSQAYVSKIVSGAHNLTIRTIFRMEELLRDDILTIPYMPLSDKARQKFRKKPVYKTCIETRSTPTSLSFSDHYAI